MAENKTTSAAPAPEITVKGLIYTKEEYETLVIDTYKFLSDHADRQDIDTAVKHDMAGLYYCAFSGLIRAGSMCRRSAGKDGFPVITLIARGREYSCPEYALYGILRHEADDLITPYDDSCNSYAGGQTVTATAAPAAPVVVNVANTGASSAEIQKLRQQYESKLQNANQSVAASKRAYEKLKKELEFEKNNSASANMQSQVAEASSRATKLEGMYQKSQEEAEHLKQETGEQIALLKNQLKKQRDANDKLKNKLEEEQKDRKRFKYNPDYDKYYSETLPKLIDSVQFSHTDIMIRTVCAAICAGGIAMSLLFMI